MGSKKYQNGTANDKQKVNYDNDVNYSNRDDIQNFEKEQNNFEDELKEAYKILSSKDTGKNLKKYIMMVSTCLIGFILGASVFWGISSFIGQADSDESDKSEEKCIVSFELSSMAQLAELPQDWADVTIKIDSVEIKLGKISECNIDTIRKIDSILVKKGKYGDFADAELSVKKIVKGIQDTTMTLDLSKDSTLIRLTSKEDYQIDSVKIDEFDFKIKIYQDSLTVENDKRTSNPQYILEVIKFIEKELKKHNGDSVSKKFPY